MGANTKLRDRDAIITKEDLVFRVYGYSYPSGSYICDPEYSPATLFTSKNPKKAIRVQGQKVYYKFYEHEGLQFIRDRFPQYTIFHEPLQRHIVGVHQKDILEMRRTDQTFHRLLEENPADKLVAALHEVYKTIESSSNLSQENFGIFGSILHGFYHPEFSDLDFVIYGKKELGNLLQVLSDLYKENAPFQNEFKNTESPTGKQWKFQNYSPEEFIWHQKRKMIYALFNYRKHKKLVKTEFEPVKKWEEINNNYSPSTLIIEKGWIKAKARVINDCESPFMPSIYQIEPIEILSGERVEHIQRIQSFVEEFRMQARKDEVIYVEGKLEQVVTNEQPIFQITLTYCPRYYEQVLKVWKR